MTSIQTTTAANGPQVNCEESYASAVSLYFHQDNLAWNRIQTIVAIEGGILAAALTAIGWRTGILVAGGTILIWLIWRLVVRDWELRDTNLKFLESCHQHLGVSFEIAPSRTWARGRVILPGVIWGIVITNVIVGFALVFPITFSSLFSVTS